MSERGLHNAYVQTKPGGYFASCPTCGMDTFPERVTHAEAAKDARAHQAEWDGELPVWISLTEWPQPFRACPPRGLGQR